jgi:hypothetical protein
VFGLSGRDGGSDEELFVSCVEVGGESAEIAGVFEVTVVARAVILMGHSMVSRSRCVELTSRATALPRLGW